jgi:Dolichyl-phosphate-mannose-protein mannosyltransferase
VTDSAWLAAHPVLRRVAPALLLALMATLLVVSSLHKRLVYDEYDNLSYGYRFLAKGPGVMPEGQRMPVLALNAIGCAAQGCDPAALDASEGERLAVRAGSMAFAIAIALMLAIWASRLFGPLGGLVALWLAAFDPTLLAHGKQVTSDVAVAAFMVGAVYAYTRWRERPSAGMFAVGVLTTAGAILSKMTGLLLVPILALLVAVEVVRAVRTSGRPTARQIMRGIATAAIFAVLVLLAINAAYGFRGSFKPARDYEWKSQAFQQHATSALPIPLPRVFAQQLDYSSLLQESPDKARGNNYVLGQLNRDGRWYAFPLMVLLKTPLAVFALAALGARSPGPRGFTTTLAIPFLVVMLFFSLAVEPQLGIRYVLPALPFLTLAAARGASDLRGRRRWLVPLFLGWQAVSTLSYAPHFVPYFNELIGRRVNAYRYLADSNLDWEDHAYFIAEYERRHGDLHLAVDPTSARSGWILVGANDLVGVFDPERYRWLREGFKPVGEVAYAHLLYYVAPERLRSARAAPSP